MPGQGFLHTSSPTPPFRDSPSWSKTSTSIPSAGPTREHGFKGVIGKPDNKHAPTSVPPEKLMIGQRLPPTNLKNHSHGSGFQGSPVEPRIRRLRTSWP